MNIMKSIDVLPCHDSAKKLKIGDVHLFQYLPHLTDEIENGLITEEEALKYYRAMLLQRGFEYLVRDLDSNRFVPYEGYVFRGSTHLSVGQEAAQTGAICALTKDDYIAVHHRAHGHCLAKGYFAYFEMESEKKLFKIGHSFGNRISLKAKECS